MFWRFFIEFFVESEGLIAWSFLLVKIRRWLAVSLEGWLVYLRIWKLRLESLGWLFRECEDWTALRSLETSYEWLQQWHWNVLETTVIIAVIFASPSLCWFMVFCYIFLEFPLILLFQAYLWLQKHLFVFKTHRVWIAIRVATFPCGGHIHRVWIH